MRMNVNLGRCSLELTLFTKWAVYVSVAGAIFYLIANVYVRIQPRESEKGGAIFAIAEPAERRSPGNVISSNRHQSECRMATPSGITSSRKASRAESVEKDTVRDQTG